VRQAVFRDERIRPDRLDQLFLRHDPVVALEERDQRIEGLGADRQHLTVARHVLGRGIDTEIGEQVRAHDPGADRSTSVAGTSSTNQGAFVESSGLQRAGSIGSGSVCTPLEHEP
jgi:hypothetical protein